MGRLKICVSDRCFFPKGAYFYSTAKMAELAQEVGYEGIEFLPTWRFVWEMKRYKKLLAPNKMIASGHRDWRFDRVMEAKIKKRPWWFYQLRNKEDWLFPPSNCCLSVLKKFQEKYKVPVSTAWFADTENFSPVMLELWSPAQGVDYQGLMRWLKENPKNHGVVIDTAKFTSWLKDNNLLKKKRQIFRRLLPHVFEVHYRSKKKGLDKAVNLGGGLRDDSDENLKFVLKEGYQGRIVVEFGWPDLEQNLLKWRGDWRQFRQFHQAIINFIRQIS